MMRHVDRRRFLARTAGFLALPALARAEAPAVLHGAAPVERIGGRAFGTGWQITLPAGAVPDGLGESVSALLGKVDRQMSPWRPDSEVSRFNAAPLGGFGVSTDTARVAAAALSLAAASGGHFDPTVGPLVARWGFGPIAGDARPGWRGLAAGDAEITKQRNGLTFDPCGIAKGFALDRMAALLDVAGCADWLIDLGGELAARGRHPAGRSWQVAIEDPRPGAAGAAAGLRLDGMAVATSGDRTNGYDLAGRRFSHIIDPGAAEPVDTALASVSVLAADAMTADGWATALMAAGAEQGPRLARANGIAALFLVRDRGELHRTETGGIAAWLL